MIGKIKALSFRSLLGLITTALIFTSYFFKNFNYISIFVLFLIISLLGTQYGLKIISKLNLLQNIRDVGPSMHLKKQNTPTIGGVFIVVPFLIALLIIYFHFDSTKILLLLLCVFGFFTIGFLDDYLSIKNKKNIGFKSKDKFILQSMISIFFIVSAYERKYIDPLILITDNWGIDIGIFIIPISFLTIVGLSNSVNLTDGLDGLAAGCSSIAFYGLGTEILLQGQQELRIFSILCFAMSGLCLGFLQYNKHPAKIFMGDTGSLSLGATLATISILTNSLLTLYIVSGIFIAETLSVIIQVSFFKITKKLFKDGKRIFLMSPLHHHFELKGFKEEFIVDNFWKINILLVILGIVLKIAI